jgi:hypothetical protein
MNSDLIVAGVSGVAIITFLVNTLKAMPWFPKEYTAFLGPLFGILYAQLSLFYGMAPEDVTNPFAAAILGIGLGMLSNGAYSTYNVASKAREARQTQRFISERLAGEAHDYTQGT